MFGIEKKVGGKKIRISGLTLELYYKGLANWKERRQVEKALAKDPGVRARLDQIKQINEDVNALFQSIEYPPAVAAAIEASRSGRAGM